MTERNEADVKKTLKKHLKGARAATIESLAKRLGILPSERVLLTTDIGITLAAASLRAAIEFLKAAPEVSRFIDSSDMRVWGEVGRRLCATSADAACNFFQSSKETLEATPEAMRTSVLRLISKQAALSANTAADCFKTAPEIISGIGAPEIAAEVLNTCLELARHSVKHSYDLFTAAPSVLAALKNELANTNQAIVARVLALTSAFAFKSGGTAAEFFAELPLLVRGDAPFDPEAIERLLSNTEAYLDRSGGVALQYFKAASRVLSIAGEDAFERWTALANLVALQGNAASYHFMKASPQIVADLAARAGKAKRGRVVSAVLEIVEAIGKTNSLAAIECFKASPLALRSASLGQFREWALRGVEVSTDVRKTQAYYALESKGSQEALFRIEGGLTLDSIAQTLRLYVEGLTGRALTIAPLASIPDESRLGDGKTIYLPSVVAEFEGEADNFRLFKVLAAHAAGQIEFDTYAIDSPGAIAALAEIRSAFPKHNEPHDVKDGDGDASGKKKPRRKKTGEGVVFGSVLPYFPNPALATRLFTTIENGRIDFLLRAAYRGIRRDLDFVRARLIERRPPIDLLPAEMIPMELLFQIALCGGATGQSRCAYPTTVGQLEQIISEQIFHESADIGDSLIATRRVYDLFVEGPRDRDDASEDSADSADEGDGSGDDAAGADPDAGQSQEAAQQTEVKDDPFSFWASGLNPEVSPDADELSETHGGESVEQDLDKTDRAFYYDEWDRELGDYRTRWCRIIERQSTRGSRGFVELVRSRYAGVISSIRYQFQLLRPENLRRIRGEIDGEDYDLQAVIDYALDVRSTGMIDDRLYIRKLRRERDVAVSFLLDMSSSTARTISRQPNKPYTQPGHRIIDIEKEGLVLMSEALEAVGDAYSMQGFTSEGRRNVKFFVIKDFSETYSSDVERRIGGITYQNNTRLGAAIRHAADRLSRQHARTKLLIILSDGRPYDHDYGDSRYAREDTRMALRHARLDGITPFCITIDRESEDQLKDMYGEVGYTIIDDVLSLPERLPGIYSRLTT